MPRIITILLFCCLLLSQAQVSQAHYLWINADQYAPQEKSVPLFSLGWGHSFYNPVGDILTDQTLIKEATLVTPTGNKLPLALTNGFQYQASHQYQPGTYLAMVQIKERFSTKTATGYLHQSKKGVDQVLSSRYLGMYAKALVTVGEAGQSPPVFKAQGTPLELVPLTDPAGLRAGEFFRFTLLYHGQPLAEEVKATYAGFAQGNAWAYSCRTNKQGVGAIKILRSGVWVIKVNHREAYPDPEEADEYSYTASLSFAVK